jgi:hypothetical protein
LSFGQALVEGAYSIVTVTMAPPQKEAKIQQGMKEQKRTSGAKRFVPALTDCFVPCASGSQYVCLEQDDTPYTTWNLEGAH